MRSRHLALLLLAGTLVPASSAFGDESTTTSTTVADVSSTTTVPETTSTSVPTSETTETRETTTTATTSSTTATTTTTVPAPVDGAGLAISVTEEAQLAEDAPVTAGVLRARLGTVEVVDERDGSERAWTVTVACTDFVTGGASPAETITCDRVRYASGDAVMIEGSPTVVPGQPPGTPAVDLAVPRVAFGAEGGEGRVRVTWIPTVEVLLPETAVSGEYRGTITHSVA